MLKLSLCNNAILTPEDLLNSETGREKKYTRNTVESDFILSYIIIYMYAHNVRPVYIEICTCVVKDALKCSFEYLSVVHHTCHKHSVGVRD